jgi:hypothetical protein
MKKTGTANLVRVSIAIVIVSLSIPECAAKILCMWIITIKKIDISLNNSID